MNWKECGRKLWYPNKAPCQRMPGSTEQAQDKTSFGIADDPAKIQIRLTLYVRL